MKLTSSGEVGYSEAEKQLFDMLSTKERRSTTELVALKYEGQRPPYYAASIVRSLMRGLAAKVERNAEAFVISKSERRGPYPVEFWIESRAALARRKKT